MARLREAYPLLEIRWFFFSNFRLEAEVYGSIYHRHKRNDIIIEFIVQATMYSLFCDQ